jgi:hypothetical protein
MDNQTKALESDVVAINAPLPTYGDVVSVSFAKSFRTWPVFFLLVSTAVPLSVTTYFMESDIAFTVGQSLLLALVMIGALFANLLATIVAVKYFLNDEEGDLFEYGREVLRSVWSYLWVMLLSSAVLFSGFILLVVPGIILSTYLVFALYVRADESGKGMATLIRSTELVRGYWLAVTGRLTVLLIAVLVAFFGAGFVLAFLVLTFGLPEAALDYFILFVLEPVFSSLGSLICLYAVTVLYKALVAEKAKTDTTVASNKLRYWYMGLAIMAAVLVGLLFLAGIFLS